MKRVWILGIGPLMVDHQFVVDLRRLDIFLGHQLLPKNLYDAVEVLYKKYGSDYYFYTLYANQYMGNRTYEILQEKHMVCRRFTLHLDKNIEARLLFDVYDDNLQYIRSFFCRSVKSRNDFCIYL